MTKTRVCMDNCGFQTIIEGISADDGSVKLEIISDCISVQKLAEELKEVNPVCAFVRSLQDSIVYQIASRSLKHPACIVPAAIIRTVEVESGIALPGNAFVYVEKT